MIPEIRSTGPRLLAAACLAVLVLGSSMGFAPAATASDDASLYLYEDTRQLIRLVEDAAALIESKGSGAFGDFAASGSRWFPDSNRYVFVYDTKGFCHFHPANKALAGKNLLDLKDLNAKPIIQNIVSVGLRQEHDASDWVTYLWEAGTPFSPQWKCSYVRKAIAPDGTVYIVGSGLYNIKIEPEFIRRRVTMAAELLQSQGKEKAFAILGNPASHYHFLNVHIFVLDIKGRSLVDPVYPTMAGRYLLDYKDAVGFPVVQEVLKKTAEAEEAWVQYLSPRPGSVLPSRKLLYAKKVMVDNETFIVGADFFMATPIWMRL